MERGHSGHILNWDGHEWTDPFSLTKPEISLLKEIFQNYRDAESVDSDSSFDVLKQKVQSILNSWFAHNPSSRITIDLG